MSRNDDAARVRRPSVAVAVLLAWLMLSGAAGAAPRGARAARAGTGPVAVAAAAAPANDPWHAARALADAGQPDSALSVLRIALAADPGNFDLRWLQAGITGEADRHKESVALYEKLGADFPERAAELRGDLATERLWSDDPAGAARDFHVWLAAHPDDALAHRRLALALAQSDSLRRSLAIYDSLRAVTPRDLDLAMERARVLGWMGRHDDAIAAYRGVLARDPGNESARLGIAMNLNWSGRHRRASRELAALASRGRRDPEAEKALAYARYWDDDPDGARRALDAYQARSPLDPEALELSRRLEQEHQPTLRFEGGRADDSDDLRVLTTGMRLTWPLAMGTTALAGWQRDNVKDTGGTRDPLRLMAGLRQHLGPAVTAYGTYAQIDWADSAGTPEGGELGLILRPVDRTRLEAVVAREPVLTRRSLQLGITLLSWVGAVDLGVTERLQVHVDGRAGYFSDGNRSERLSASTRLRVFARRGTEFALKLATEQLNTRLDLDHGYYDPDFHREWGPGYEAEWHPRANWSLGTGGQVGWQRDKDSKADRFYIVSGRTELMPSERWTLALEGVRSNSSLQSDSGYKRTWWQISIVRGF